MQIILQIGLVILLTKFIAANLFAQDPFSGPINIHEGDNYVSGGLAWGDYDGDGDQDLFFSNGTSINAYSNYLYRNNGSGTFTKITSGDIVNYSKISGGCAWGDYNNDGSLDMYVAHAVDGFTSLPNKLYKNNGDGTFSDVSAGDLTEAVPSATVSWADYNNDGWIDGFTSNVSTFGGAASHRLYSSDQDGVGFSSVSNNLTGGSSGLGGIAWADYDSDGDQDVVTLSGNKDESTVLWTNTGTNFTSTTLLTGRDAKAASWGDYDNDGDPDLYITVYAVEQNVPDRNVFFRNDNGTLTQITSGVFVTDEDYSYGSAWGDYDNDGDLDLYVATGGDATNYSRLYKNDGSGNFTRLTSSNIVDSVNFARGAAWADCDNDGDLDMVVGRDGPNYLFKNNGNSNNWVILNLEGVYANKAAIGAVVRLKATIGGEPTWQMREISTQTGYGGHSSLRVHFGLENASNIDSLKIEWPGSGNADAYTNMSVNAIYDITEQYPSSIYGALNKPQEYQLKQNYPNPFNPNTRIEYVLPSSALVTLNVYNVAGQKIATLIDGPKQAGTNFVDFNASNLPAGLYFYHIRSGGITQVKKMMLIK